MADATDTTDPGFVAPDTDPADETDTAPGTFRGWNQFRKAVNMNLPNSLDRASVSLRSALRIL